MTKNAIRDFVEARMAKFKVAKYVFFTDAFLMNAAGKVSKRELSKDAAERTDT